MRIGWIGIGGIGLPMMLRVARAGHRVIALDKDAARAAQAEQSGVALAASPAALGRDCDVVILNLPGGNAVTDVVFGTEGCVAGGMAGKLLIDTSSIDPVLTRDLAARLRGFGGRWVDAPVSGGVRAAGEGALVAFVGGAEEDAKAAQPWLACFADRQTWLGPSGCGQWAKLVNQAIVCGTIALWSDAMKLAQDGGLDPSRLVDALTNSGADSRVRAAFGAQIGAGDFVPSDNLAKDIATVLARLDDTNMDPALLRAVGAVIDAMRRG